MERILIRPHADPAWFDAPPNSDIQTVTEFCAPQVLEHVTGTKRWRFCQSASGFTPLLATQLKANEASMGDLMPTRIFSYVNRVSGPPKTGPFSV
jgi:hypothetical protein